MWNRGRRVELGRNVEGGVGMLKAGSECWFPGCGSESCVFWVGVLLGGVGMFWVGMIPTQWSNLRPNAVLGRILVFLTRFWPNHGEVDSSLIRIVDEASEM